MIQDLLTYLLIASATAYMLFSLYRMIYPSKKGQAVGCAGCSGCSHDITQVKNKAIVKILRSRSYSSGSGSAPAGAAGKAWVPRDFASSDLANRLQ
jgi:hypothetical protein